MCHRAGTVQATGPWERAPTARSRPQTLPESHFQTAVASIAEESAENSMPAEPESTFVILKRRVKTAEGAGMSAWL